ncbi:VWA domain-containing protein [Geitlerinema sp. PCC 9228]|jgi:hypothetical protein|uniref:VWA domain-containing protein n=1 Tax=Geitlerinema sp. PCC 9228 TaxID=111611 RepID=UPI0008F9B0F6|nr:VWA domain-containing protein [Geitlerinema sp. PCC 9228]
MLENRDYTLIIDKSGSMANADEGETKSKWEQAKESTFALAQKCEEVDPDGLTVYLFSGAFRRYDNVTADKVAQIFQENQPMGSTNLVAVFEDAFENYFQRRQKGQTKQGETFLVVTDGEPDDRKATIQSIVDTTHRLQHPAELAILLIQVGKDERVKRFLQALDDELQGVGAKFDIVETFSIDIMQGKDLSEVLLAAIAQ